MKSKHTKLPPFTGPCPACKEKIKKRQDAVVRLSAEMRAIARAKPAEQMYKKFNPSQIYKAAREFHGDDAFFIEVYFADDDTFNWKSGHSRFNGSTHYRYGLYGRQDGETNTYFEIIDGEKPR